MLPKQTAASLRAAFGAKVQGAVNVASALAGTGTGVLVGFSSIASLLGNAGQINYAAANGALDAWATHQQCQVQQQQASQASTMPNTTSSRQC